MMHLKQWAPFSQYKCMNLEFFSDFEKVCLNGSHFTFEPHTRLAGNEAHHMSATCFNRD